MELVKPIKENLPDLSQYVTFKWLVGACFGLCIGGAAVTAAAMNYMDERFDRKANAAAVVRIEKVIENYNDDVSWIKQCMIQKCWDNGGKVRQP